MEYKVFTIGEVAKFLQVKPSTMYRWRHNNKGPKCSRIGRKLLYAEADILQFLRDNQKKEVVPCCQ